MPRADLTQDENMFQNNFGIVPQSAFGDYKSEKQKKMGDIRQKIFSLDFSIRCYLRKTINKYVFEIIPIS